MIYIYEIIFFAIKLLFNNFIRLYIDIFFKYNVDAEKTETFDLLWRTNSAFCISNDA